MVSSKKRIPLLDFYTNDSCYVYNLVSYYVKKHYIERWLVGSLGFMACQPFVSYLMPNLFLFK